MINGEIAAWNLILGHLPDINQWWCHRRSIGNTYNPLIWQHWNSSFFISFKFNLYFAYFLLKNEKWRHFWFLRKKFYMERFFPYFSLNVAFFTFLTIYSYNISLIWKLFFKPKKTKMKIFLAKKGGSISCHRPVSFVLTVRYNTIAYFSPEVTT